MHSRLQEIIKYKTGGRQADFARLLGWTPQYLAKLTGGGNFGLQPVLTILQKLPEIDARWFLFGQGEMLTDSKVSGLKRELMTNVQRILDLERFLPVMLPQELKEFEDAVATGRIPSFSDEQIKDLQLRLRAKEEDVEARFNNALQNAIS